MTSLWFNGCTNLLCLPPILVDHFYFAIMLIANVLNCLVALASIYRVIRRQSFCRPHGENDDKLPSDGTAPAVTVVVACYLPNEQVIIESTIEHILLQLDWPSDLTLHIVYNTPSALPFEDTLRRLEGCHYAPRRKLRITKVDASTSKAENLNHILPTITDEFVVLYDADHHPDTNSLVRLASDCGVGAAFAAGAAGTHGMPVVSGMGALAEAFGAAGLPLGSGAVSPALPMAQIGSPTGSWEPAGA